MQNLENVESRDLNIFARVLLTPKNKVDKNGYTTDQLLYIIQK